MTLKNDVDDRKPLVSVIVSNFNGARYLPPLLDSLRRQSLRNNEIIVIDDASTDESLSIMAEAAQRDPRIRVQAMRKNGGPAAARNKGLSLAQGDWIAIVDSDDIVHPCRLQKLIDRAIEKNVQIIADDMIVFYEEGGAPHRFLEGKRSKVAGLVSIDDYVRENAVLSSCPALGYLKPVFHRISFEKLALRYDEKLRIGEDYHLMARALAAGLSFWIEPFPYYLYRKHNQSISNRLSNALIVNMIKADEALATAHGSDNAGLRSAVASRTSSLKTLSVWNDCVDKIKTWNIFSGAALVARHPAVLPLTILPVAARWRRLMRALRRKSAHGSRILREGPEGFVIIPDVVSCRDEQFQCPGGSEFLVSISEEKELQRLSRAAPSSNVASDTGR